MNGPTLLALIAIAIGVLVAYRIGVQRGRRVGPQVPMESVSNTDSASPPAKATAAPHDHELGLAEAELVQLRSFAEDRRALYAALSQARAETARYRQIVVDIETHAPPPLLDSPHAPDDLKLIVGVGPVIERMLQQLGVVSYRQIARWTERDIDEFEARLGDFPGRIRRDGWVTQARALHQSKYGDNPKDRG